MSDINRSHPIIKKKEEIIKQLKSRGLDFNCLFILECYKERNEFLKLYDIPSLNDLTISSAHQYLKKEEYIVEDPHDSDKLIISVKGTAFLSTIQDWGLKSINEVQGASFVVAEVTKDELFEEWWNMYPTTPKWETDDKVTKFLGSRNLKNITKSKAKTNYLKLLNQGLKHEDLLGALKYEIKLKKLDSIKKKENQLEYFKGMESYFNTNRYMLFIEGYKQDPSFVDDVQSKVKSKKLNVTDI
jgi:hypothetical protein